MSRGFLCRFYSYDYGRERAVNLQSVIRRLIFNLAGVVAVSMLLLLLQLMMKMIMMTVTSSSGKMLIDGRVSCCAVDRQSCVGCFNSSLIRSYLIGN